jgi:mannose-6-phosphate isomerase-like protein (cupin superfamily)
MKNQTQRGAIISASEFVYHSTEWGRVAEPVGPALGAERIRLNVAQLSSGSHWSPQWAVGEENVVVVFSGRGDGTVASQRHSLRRSSALYSATGHELALHAGAEGMTAYIWRTRLEGHEQRGSNPRIVSELDNTETQLRGFSGTGEVAAAGETAVMNFVFWPGTGSSRLCLHCGVMEPGQTFNVHTHPDSEEAFIAVTGKGQLHLDGRWYDAQAGDVLFAAPGVPHGTRHPNSDPDAGSFATCGGPTPFDPVLYERAGVSTEVR